MVPTRRAVRMKGGQKRGPPGGRGSLLDPCPTASHLLMFGELPRAVYERDRRGQQGMSPAPVQLTRLISFKTASRRTSRAASPSFESTAAASSLLRLGSRRRSLSFAQDHLSASSANHRGGKQGVSSNVRIEVFAHGASGKEAVLVAFLSNFVLLVMRVGAEGLRSWLLEWPVAGKIRGLGVSPDLQCILCVTEGLEGVYLLAVDNLSEQDEAQPHPTEAVSSLDDGMSAPGYSASALCGDSSSLERTAGGGGTGGPRVSERTRKESGDTKRTPVATARHVPKRAVADTAFPSLIHLASRGELRKRGGIAKARHPPAEPVFIASLARRGGGGAAAGGGGMGHQERQESDDGRGSRRHSTGLGGRGPRQRSGYECLWWVTREGDHFAIIGGPGGEVHFLDLERLSAWIVTPPPPAMARGRVCALSIVSDLARGPQRSSERAAGASEPSPPNETPDQAVVGAAATVVTAPASAAGNAQSHLVAVLETGAVFIVLLERSSNVRSSGGVVGAVKGDSGVNSKIKDKTNEAVEHGGGGGSSSRLDSAEDYVRLGANKVDQPEFTPSWLDVGRGGGGGGGGGMGVRVMPTSNPSGNNGDALSRHFRVSIVSRAWGNKSTVRVLRVAGTPGAGATGSTRDKPKEAQEGWGREWGISGSGSGSSAKQQAFRTETVRQVTLPVDHPAPEQHALAVVDGDYAVLASPPIGGVPARVAVAPLGGPERPAAHPVCVFPLPAGEHVSGVALLPCGGGNEDIPDGGQVTGSTPARGPTSWGLVWSESCVYRIDLGGDGRQAWAVPKPAESGGDAAAASQQPSSTTTTTTTIRRPGLLPASSSCSRQSPAKTAGSVALHRPSASSVRRARELHAAGQLSEATQVAMEALDGSQSPLSTPARGAGGGGVTTRMVREELANSLLEWLVTLHVRQAEDSTSLSTAGQAATKGRDEEGRASITDKTGGSSGSPSSGSFKFGTPEDDRSKARRGSGWARSDVGFAARRGSMLSSPSSRLAWKSGLKDRESAVATSKATTAKAPAAAAAAAPSFHLERYLLSSRDYDPVFAAVLLHEHGEADLAVVAGAARREQGEGPEAAAVLCKVLRVLAESAWPPRLGLRAVEAMCGDEAGAAAREVILASGGALFAGMEPCLQLRVLLFEKSIMFGSKEAGEATIGGAAEAAVEAVGGGAVASVRANLGPLVPALAGEDLRMLIARLAQWCKQDVAERDSEGGREDATAVEVPPSNAALEALEVLLQALCELGRRPPPLGEHHRCAWAHAGCIKGDTLATRNAEEPVSQPLEWAKLPTFLCDVFADEGAGCTSGEEPAGGLAAAARRQLLRVLPAIHGWHDPVGALLRLREAECWAAVAVQLELTGNDREAASATLHGVVTLLRGGNKSAPGEIARILRGEGHPRPPEARRAELGAQTSEGPPGTAAARDDRRTASEAVLRVIDRYAFPPKAPRPLPPASGRPPTAPYHPVAPLPTTTSAAAAAAAAALERRAAVLSEALCLWKYFGLPVAELEACLRPRLEDRDGVLVLAAVLFPKLLPPRDAARSGAPRDSDNDGGDGGGSHPRGQDRQRGQRWESAEGEGGGRSGWTPVASPYLHEMGLSPRFLFELTRAAGKPVGPGPTAAPPAGLGPFNVSPPYYLKNGPWGTGGVEAAVTSSPPALTLLLEHRARGGGGGGGGSGGAAHASSLSAVYLGAPVPASSAAVGRSGGRAEAGGSAWPPDPNTSGVQGYGPPHAPGTASTAASTAATADRKNEVWFFTCGHRYPRQHLADYVVPASFSSVRQATASLERTQQVLTLEYGGRKSSTAGAACPECVAKELVRLAAVAGATMQGRASSTNSASSSLPPSPPQSAQRLLTQ